MSVRQSREELIKRGVLKEIFEKGSALSHLMTSDLHAVCLLEIVQC